MKQVWHIGNFLAERPGNSKVEGLERIGGVVLVDVKGIADFMPDNSAECDAQFGNLTRAYEKQAPEGATHCEWVGKEGRFDKIQYYRS